MRFKPIVDALWQADLRLVRVAIVVASLLWAAVLLGGGYQFNRPAYLHLLQLAPQQAWGGAFLIVGALQTTRALLGLPTSSGIYACVAATASAFLWCCVTFALGLSQVPTPAVNSGNIVVTALSILILIRTIARHG
jgi:hypothetical protein